MSPQGFRRIGWLVALGTCTALYLMLHLQVHAVLSEVVRAERQLVALEQEKLLLETEFETRANQVQLAAWNRVDFGYTAPTAEQYLENERELASFGGPPLPGSPSPIRVAGAATGDEPRFPRLVSPLTGKPIDQALLEPGGRPSLASDGIQIALGAAVGSGTQRIPLNAVIASAAE